MALNQQQLAALVKIITEETGLKLGQVTNTINLLQDGATVPFIARYRKEQTGELDEVQIRTIEERLAYFTELEARRQTILTSIREQGKLTPELQARIETTRQKTELEDLYLPTNPSVVPRPPLPRNGGWSHWLI